MSTTSVKLLSVCASALLAVWLGAHFLEAESSLRLEKLPRLNGSVMINYRPTGNTMRLGVWVRRGSDPVSRLDVKLMSSAAAEERPGHYVCNIEGINPVAGNSVVVTFRERHVLPPASGRESGVVATAVINAPPAFVQPAPNARISLAAPALSMTVSWMGGSGPYSLHVVPFSGKKELGEPVFSRTDIAGNSVRVPLSLLVPGQKYGIYLSCVNSEFAFTIAPDPASRFRLYSSVATYIFTE